MRALKFGCLALLLASPAAFALSGSVVATDNVKAHLVSEVSSVGPGQVFWVALELDIRDGWHTYWRNPGDSGEATKLAWQLPPGFSAGDIVWTTPHRFEIAPLVNYGYAKHAVHLVQITAPKDLKAGPPVLLSAKASWLVCSDVCIPERCEFAADPAGERPAGRPRSGRIVALFAAARSRIAQCAAGADHRPNPGRPADHHAWVQSGAPPCRRSTHWPSFPTMRAASSTPRRRR